MIRVQAITIPEIWSTRYVLGLRGLFTTISAIVISICPPSKVGTGIRFPIDIEILIMDIRYSSVLIPLLLLSENARVEIRPMFLALVKGPLITSNASLKLKLNSFIIAAAVRFERSSVLIKAV